MRKTPYQRIRYPWASDVVSVADVQSMASDIDAALVTTAKQASDFSRFATVVAQRAAVQSITKATLTAISFDSVPLNNGANSPMTNSPWWVAGSPTRLTAPVACVVFASASGGLNLGSALGANGAIEVTTRLNGTSTRQGNKWNPPSAVSGQQWTSGLAMWELSAGDYIEMMMYWTGTPAGPFNTDTVAPPTLSLMMLALQQVP